MPKTSWQTAPMRTSMEGREAAYEHLEGGYTAGFESYSADLDPERFFAGLPDDRCQSPHWGYVIRGRILFRYADHEETYEAGDAYYAPPGHTPVVFVGSEVVEFSPTEALMETFAVLTQNLRAAGTPA